MSTLRVELSQLGTYFEKRVTLFICMASFEERCLGVAKNIDKSNVQHVLIFSNEKNHDLVKPNREALKAIFIGSRIENPELQIGKPLDAGDIFFSTAIAAIKATVGLAVVDVTTFTHEQVLILFRQIEMNKLQSRVVFCYVGAGEYSVGLPVEKKWLSRGVLQVRSVLGYSGLMLPSRRLHLVVLVGFEHERAQAVIERYEPAILSLGLGHPTQSVNETLYGVNKAFFDRVQRFADSTASTLRDVNKFEFSCIDPRLCSDAINGHIAQYPGYNVALCPMNTKLSTLGAALTVTKNPEIQLCYAQAAEYNVDGYSTPGDSATVFILD